jgi:hypothetical protein
MNESTRRFMGDNVKIIFNGCDIYNYQVNEIKVLKMKFN